MNKFIKRNLFAIIFLLVILVAVFLRFYQLGINPPSLTWDEASIGYNAYSVLKTGADEYGNKFPLSIRSFDDYKPPLYTYLAVPFVGVFGLNEFSVRLPAAIIGILFIIVIYFLVKEILQKWDKKCREAIALVAAFFLAISPWHLQFSRAAFEGSIGVFFLMAGMWAFLVGLRKKHILFLSVVAFILSLYSYHSFRMVIPLLILFLIILFLKQLLAIKKIALVALFALIVFSIPVYLNFIFSSQGSSSRLLMVTIFSPPDVLNKSIERLEYDRSKNYILGELFDNRRVAYFFAAVRGYFEHFNPDFLFIRGDGGIQHHAVDFGMLYLFDIPFILIGAYILARRRNKYIVLIFVLLFLAPLPASITTGAPHPVRAIAMFVPIHIIAAAGIVILMFKLAAMPNRIITYGSMVVIIFLFLLNISYYFHQYYIHTPREYGYFWQYGYKEAVNYAKDNEAKFDRIIITYKYDQPYIYYLFYNKVDPFWYQENWDYNKTGATDRFKRVVGKYIFKNIDYTKDSVLPKTLLIGTLEEIPDNAKVIKVIKFPDGKIAFKIAET